MHRPLLGVLLAVVAGPAIVLAQFEINPAEFEQGFNLSSCYLDGATAFALPVYYVEGHGMCPPGFYCPNSFFNNSLTYPTICPAQEDCVLLRRTQQYCEAQGVYEPIVCPEGWYCPTAMEIQRCPEGSWCPSGAIAPYGCSSLSYCPEGSVVERFYGCILILFLVDMLVLAVFILERRQRGQRSEMAALEQHGNPSKAAEGGTANEGAALVAAELISEGLGLKAAAPNVEFHNLQVQLPKTHETAPGKRLLQGVSGRFEAGKVTAIMGPSGAGKTVLFQTILGKQPEDWEVCGDVLVGDEQGGLAALRPMVGFVPQDDVLRPELSVLENIMYTSDIRLPAEWDAERRQRLQTAVVRAAGLESIRDLAIESPQVHGYRKQVGVAMELACAPTAMFLDEPTTGLDASTALDLVRLLQVIARAANIPVAMVIHQPRVEIWEALDEVLLLAPGGRTVFEGKMENVVPTLQEALEDMQNGETPLVSKTSVVPDFEHGNPSDAVMDCIGAYGQDLATRWDNKTKEALAEDREPANSESLPPPAPTSLPTRDTAPFLKQIAMAHVREVKSQLRSPDVFAYDLLLGMIGGVLLTTAAADERFVGALISPYVVLSPRTDVQVAAMVLLLWGMALAATFGPSGVRVLGQYKTVYWREAAAGHGRLSYFLGAVTASLYRTTLVVLHFSVVVYLMWRPLLSYGQLLWVLLMFGVGLQTQSVMFGALLPLEVAPLLAMLLCVAASLLNGFPSIPGSIAVYTFHITELLYVFEMAKVDHVFQNTLDIFDYSQDRAATNYAVWLIEVLLFCVLAFAALVRMNKDKQR